MQLSTDYTKTRTLGTGRLGDVQVYMELTLAVPSTFHDTPELIAGCTHRHQ
jgi:hypothetical protein